MLSAVPWSTQDRQIGLDLATANYPNITGAGETVCRETLGVVTSGTNGPLSLYPA